MLTNRTFSANAFDPKAERFPANREWEAYRLTDTRDGREVASSVARDFPQALHVMASMVWNTLEAFGKLDTQAAVDAMGNVQRQQGFPLTKGEAVSLTVSNTGHTITLARVS